MPYTENNPPPPSTQPGDPIWQLITPQVAEVSGYPASLIGQYVINGRIPYPEDAP